MKTAIIGALLVLLGIAIGYYVGFGKKEPVPQAPTDTQTLEDTTATETQPKTLSTDYQNDKYSFGFDYDKDRFVVFEPDEATAAAVLFTEEDWNTFEGQASGREAPPAITVDVFANPNNLSALEWVESETRSNFGLGNQTYEGVEVDGELGVLYNWDGLYQGESAVVAYSGSIYMLSVTYLERSDPLVGEFTTVLKSFSFAN